MKIIYESIITIFMSHTINKIPLTTFKIRLLFLNLLVVFDTETFINLIRSQYYKTDFKHLSF